MYFYYQTVENCKQQWQPADARQEDQIRREKAFHMSIYQVDKTLEGVDPEEVRYKGDLWFDIDHKPEEGGDVKAAIHDAIIDVRRLISYLESIDTDPRYLQLYASGGKGFHLCIPSSLFNGGPAARMLPKIYKHMAEVIRDRASVTGLDMGTYSIGKGKMLRVENKPRANGKFKVPVTVEEIKVMTPEMYLDLTSKPRVVQHTQPVGIVIELSNLFLEAQQEFERQFKAKIDRIPNEMLNVFSDGNHPACVTQIVTNTGCKSFEGAFNAAKMSVARYLVSAPITEAESNDLLDTFARSWTPTRYRTESERKKAVTEAFGFARDNGFGCGFMYSILVDKPCTGCPLREEQDRQVAERSPIQSNRFAYVRDGRTPVAISNFVLKIRARYRDVYDDPTTFSALDCDVYRGDKHLTTVTLSHKAWLSNAEFKKQVSQKAGLSWTGNDNDLQYLKALLTDTTALEGVQVMKHTKSMGIHHHIDEELGIDEFVWVEDHWSTNGIVSDTLKFNGVGPAEGETICVKMQGLKPFTGRDNMQNLTLSKLLKANAPEIIAPVVGWMAGCWLRTHWRASEDTNKHLPALQIYGSSGHGKTETATLFATLAGADFVRTEPLVVSASTPYAIKTEAAMTTTVPRIFDEMNEHKISERNKYSAAREAVKSSARAGAQKTGAIGEGGVAIDSKPSTAPIVMLATQLNPEQEIQERTIPVSINKAHRTPEHTANFRFARMNVEHLRALAARLMRVTLNLSIDWVVKTAEKNRLLLDESYRDDRTGMNWQFVLTGLDFLHYALQERSIQTLSGPVKYYAAESYVLDEVVGLKKFLVEWLQGHAAELGQASVTQEIDKIIDTFGEMVIEAGAMGPKFKSGEHYHLHGDTLYIWSAVFFPQYLRYCRVVRMHPPELTSIKQYNDLLKHQEYCLGSSAPMGARVNQGWHALHMPTLRERGVRIENFIE